MFKQERHIVGFILMLYGAAFFCNAQSKVDSLNKVLLTEKLDTQKVKILSLLATQFRNNEPAKALGYVKQALDLCKRSGYDTVSRASRKITATVYRQQGACLYFLGEYGSSIASFQRALAFFEEVKDDEGEGSIYGWLGNVYYSKGDFEKALAVLLKSTKLLDRSKNKAGFSGALNGIANIYQAQGNHKMALDYYFQSLKIKLTMDDSINVAYTYNNIGLAYMESDSLEKALVYHAKCLKLVERYEDKKGMENSYGNIGEIYTSQKKYKLALEYQLKALKIAEEIGDKTGMSASYNAIGQLYEKLNEYGKALVNFEKGLVPALTSGNKASMRESYRGIASSHFALDNYQKAVDNFEQYTIIKDSLMNESNMENIEEMQVKFDTEKKEGEILLLQKDKSIRDLQISEQSANINRQRIVIYSVAAGLLLLLLLIFFIWKSYREKKRINQGLAKINAEINLQKDLIAEKNLQITDSIDYARNIQQAVLPSDELIKAALPASFIFFLPKDIVSGDFYWLHEKKDTLIFAVVDCTGHGVPGAFMSVMAYNMLENIVSGNEEKEPGIILDELNNIVLSGLQQDNDASSAKYGMDISLIAFNKRSRLLQFAGAHNPLIMVTGNGELKELKADKATIGMALTNFTQQEIELQTGDTLYLYTDGYADQKGGPNNKKFLTASLKELLSSIASFSMSEQKQRLEEMFNKWKAGKEQLDDVLVAGIRV